MNQLYLWLYRFRYRGQTFNPETVFLQAAQQRVTQMRRSRNMKEKLIHAAEGLQVGVSTSSHINDLHYDQKHLVKYIPVIRSFCYENNLDVKLYCSKVWSAPSI